VEVLEQPDRLHTAPERMEVSAEASGVVHRVRPRPLGEAVVALGGGRTRVEDLVDPGVGFEVWVRPGDRVERGDALGRVHARDSAGLELGRRALAHSVEISDGEGPIPLPLLVDRIS